jgi:hypothetical protein
MSSKSHIHKRCGTLVKKSFSARGYAEVHIQRPFFDNKIAYEKFLDWKSKRWKHALVPLLYIEYFIFEKY